MRRSAASLLLLVAACGEEGAQAPRGEAIECALAGAERFKRSCTVEQREGEEGLTLTIRNEEGGFRRILIRRDGRGAVAADGAEPASVREIGGSRVEVSIGGDRYLLPPTLGGPAR